MDKDEWMTPLSMKTNRMSFLMMTSVTDTRRCTCEFGTEQRFPSSLSVGVTATRRGGLVALVMYWTSARIDFLYKRSHHNRLRFGPAEPGGPIRNPGSRTRDAKSEHARIS